MTESEPSTKKQRDLLSELSICLTELEIYLAERAVRPEWTPEREARRRLAELLAEAKE